MSRLFFSCFSYSNYLQYWEEKVKALVNTMGKLAEIIYHCLQVQEPYQYHGTYYSKSKKI